MLRNAADRRKPKVSPHYNRAPLLPFHTLDGSSTRVSPSNEPLKADISPVRVHERLLLVVGPSSNLPEQTRNEESGKSTLSTHDVRHRRVYVRGDTMLIWYSSVSKKISHGRTSVNQHTGSLKLRTSRSCSSPVPSARIIPYNQMGELISSMQAAYTMLRPALEAGTKLTGKPLIRQIQIRCETG